MIRFELSTFNDTAEKANGRNGKFTLFGFNKKLVLGI